jgi:(1->4)-alpha-D-glucan 1-alpha-D-glucosylmutase
LLHPGADVPNDTVRDCITFVQKFQQFTGPAAAKGIEDTALYTYVPLVSLNEVGGQPDVPLEDALARLHEANAYRAKQMPHSMLCVTTHDTKRTADVRSRLDVLSEIPAPWKACVKRWLKANRVARIVVNGVLVPDFGAEYLFYQTAVGIWPHDSQRTSEDHSLSEAEREELRQRLEQYMIKALREAKRHTNWTSPNERYEAAIVGFIRQLLPGQPSRFEIELQALVEQIAYAGYWNALARTVIQFTAPGFPDIYQGDEIWNVALVDPDNRRPVDFTGRNQLLNSLTEERESNAQDQNAFWQSMLERPADGRVKLFVMQALLHARRAHESLFQRGTYKSLEVMGAKKQHVFAFYRRYEQQALIVVVPRLTLSLVQQPDDVPVGAKVWGDTSIILPEGSKQLKWISGLTNSTTSVVHSTESPTATLPIEHLLGELPVGLYFSASPEEVPDSSIDN